jgi:PIN domain nuclease of toxin-antitoxin system
VSVLLDTNGWIGFLGGDPKFSSKAKKCLLNENVTVFVSIASVWEASIKVGLGKLELPYDLERDLPGIFEQNEFELLPISLRQATRVKDLEPIHGDPFDRIQVIQARELRLDVISRDAVFDRYGVKRIW